MDDLEEEEVVYLWRCEHCEMLTSSTSDPEYMWKSSHERKYEGLDVCQPSIYKIPLTEIKNNIEVEEFNID